MISSGNSGGTYIYNCIYEEYLTNKIRNEEKIASYIKPYIPVNESSYKNIRVITEAKLTDKIKAGWKKFIQFIKGIFAKFMESMSNLILNEKKYLEKYKDIILKKQPKEIDFSYTGDYDTGIKRCINTPVPVFNYSVHAEALKKEGDEAIISIIMRGKGFTYDAGNDSLADQFKSYFIAADKGQTTGKFNDGKLNFTNMYNFCMNFKQIEDITKKDEKYLETSTNAIFNAINAKIKENGEKTNTETTSNDNQTEQPQNKNVVKLNQNNNNQTEQPQNKNVVKLNQNNNNQTEQQSKNKNVVRLNQPPSESRDIYSSTEKEKQAHNNSFRFATGKYFIEADNNDKAATSSGLSIDTNAITKMNSYENNRTSVSDDDKSTNAAAAANGNNTVQEMQNMCDKWIRVCRSLITAKCTAVQQIAKDYMTIIRAHVRSYVGNTKDKTTDITPQQGTDYSKNTQSNNTETKQDNNQSNQQQNNNKTEQQSKNKNVVRLNQNK